MTDVIHISGLKMVEYIGVKNRPTLAIETNLICRAYIVTYVELHSQFAISATEFERFRLNVAYSYGKVGFTDADI